MPPTRRAPPQADSDAEIRRAVNTEPTAIQEEYCAVPRDIHAWAHAVAVADKALNIAEDALKVFEAKEGRKIIDAVPAGEKVPGEGIRQDRVRSSDGYQERLSAVTYARWEKAKAFAVLEAVRTKKELIISLGADLRQDRDDNVDPVIRDQRRRRA